MLIFFAVFLLHIVSAVTYYSLATMSAMQGHRWAMIGILLGVFAVPLFISHRHMQWRRSVGFNSRFMLA